MAVLAEPTIAPLTDDRLARRNALVLAGAQALAGGNSTVIFGSAGIIGTVLAPDKSLGTLPITAYVVGLWIGTLPVGAIANALGAACRVRGRRPVRRARRPCLRFRGDPRLVCAALPRDRLRRALRGGAPVLPFRRRRHRERGVQAEGDLVGAHGGRAGGRARPAAHHPDQEHPAALPVRGEL